MIQQQVSAQALRISSVPEASAARIRSQMRDDYGNDLVVQDGEGAPCRVCLRYGKRGEHVILFSYKPFDKPAPYQEVGPIFVHAEPCKQHSAYSGFPKDFQDRPLILRPYDAQNRIQDSQIFADAGEAPTIAARLLENPEVAYVHARSLSRGCYLFRIERG